MGGKITTAALYRTASRTPEEITELARDNLLGVKWVVADPRTIQSAFYMMLVFVEITPAAAKRIGALIGDPSDAVRGRAMNGCPIFLSMGFLLKRDVEFFDAETDRLRAALGLPTTTGG